MNRKVLSVGRAMAMFVIAVAIVSWAVASANLISETEEIQTAAVKVIGAGSNLDDSSSLLKADVFADLTDGKASTYVELEHNTHDFIEINYTKPTSGNAILYLYKVGGDKHLTIYKVVNGVPSDYIMEEVKNWRDSYIDISDLVCQQQECTIRIAKDNYNRRVKIAEARVLKNIYRVEDFQIIEKGVSTTQLDETVEERWDVFGKNAFKIDSANCGVYSMNGTLIKNITDVSIVNEDDISHITARFFANSTEFEEGKNYYAQCSAVIDGKIMLNDIKQFFYVTREKSIFEKIGEVIGRLLGIEQKVDVVTNITNSTNAVVNEIKLTVDNLNATTSSNYDNLTSMLQSIQSNIDYTRGAVLNATEDSKNQVIAEISDARDRIVSNITEMKGILLDVNSTLGSKIDIVQNSIDEANARLDEINQTVNSRYSALDSLIRSVNLSDEQRKAAIISHINSLESNINGKIDDMWLDINATLLTISGKVDDVSLKVDAVNQSLQYKLDMIKQQVDDNGNEILRNQQFITVVNSTVNSIYDDTQFLIGEVATIQAKLDNILAKLDNLTSQLTSLENTMGVEFTEVKQKLNQTIEQISALNQTLGEKVSLILGNITESRNENLQYKQEIINELQNSLSTTLARIDALESWLDGKFSNISALVNATGLNETQQRYLYEVWCKEYPDVCMFVKETTRVSVVGNYVRFLTYTYNIDDSPASNVECRISVYDSANATVVNSQLMEQVAENQFQYVFPKPSNFGQYSYEVACSKV